MAAPHPVYSAEFVSAIDLWLSGMSFHVEVGQFLTTEHLPEKFQFVAGPLFRGLGLPLSRWNRLDAGATLRHAGLSSWSKSKRVARSFAKDKTMYGDPEYGREVELGLLITKTFSRVLLDVDALLKDEAFQQSAAYWRRPSNQARLKPRDFARLRSFIGFTAYPAKLRAIAGYTEDSQREVVVNGFSFTREDVLDVFYPGD